LILRQFAIAGHTKAAIESLEDKSTFKSREKQWKEEQKKQKAASLASAKDHTDKRDLQITKLKSHTLLQH